MILAFLTPDAAVADDRFAPVARSPMEREARAAGATFAVRDGWSVAVAYGDGEAELAACRERAGWADVSHLGKLELQAPRETLATLVASAAGGARLELGRATRAEGAWWCPLTPQRALVVADASAAPALRAGLEEAAAAAPDLAGVVDVTTAYAALTVAGPGSRELLARLTALDLRPQVTPLRGLRPGSVARVPAIVLREDADRFLVLFGAAHGQYVWSVVADAGAHLGGAPVGADALARLGERASEPEASPRA